MNEQIGRIRSQLTKLELELAPDRGEWHDFSIDREKVGLMVSALVFAFSVLCEKVNLEIDSQNPIS